MMEPAQERRAENLADRLNRARQWRILAQGQVGARLVVVGLVRQQQMAKVPFAKHDDMVDAFPTDRADEPFDIGVLPGRARRGRSISDAERPKAPGDDLPISAISITNEVPRSMLPAARLRELSSNPFRGRVFGCGRPHDPASVTPQDKKAEEQAKGNGWDHERDPSRQCHRHDCEGTFSSLETAVAAAAPYTSRRSSARYRGRA